MFGAHAHEILPGLWLGSKAAAEDTAWQQEKGIYSIFNATKTLPFPETAKFTHRIPVDDNLAPTEIANMEKFAPEALFKMIREMKAGHPILVHCHAGMQRSAALVAMYLIANRGLNADQAMKYVRDRRSVAFFPMANFKDAIYGFERTFLDTKQKILGLPSGLGKPL